MLWATHSRPYWTTSLNSFFHPFFHSFSSSVQVQHPANQQKSNKEVIQLERLQRRQKRRSQDSPTERMAKLKSVHQNANSGNLSKVAITCNVEKVKTMRYFWEMKFEPEVSMQAPIYSILGISLGFRSTSRG